MAITTTTEQTAPVNVIFQQTYLRQAKARCPYFAGTLPGTLQSKQGSFTVKWRRMVPLNPTTTPLAELTGNLSLPTRTASQITQTDLTEPVKKYGDFIFLTEEADLVNFNTMTDQLMETLGIQAGRSLNRLQRNEQEDNSTVLRSGGVATDGDIVEALTRTVVKRAVNELNVNSALLFTPMTQGADLFNTTPIRSSYWGICHSDVEEDIRDFTTFFPVERYSSQTQTEMGEFGIADGVRWISTPEGSIVINAGGTPATNGLRSTGGTSADIYKSLVYGMEAYGSVSLDTTLIKEVYLAGDNIPGVQVIAKAMDSGGIGNPLNEVGSMGWKFWHAAKVLNNTWARVIHSGAKNIT